MTEGPTVASDPKSSDSLKPDANSEIGEITDKLRAIIVVGVVIACLWGLGIYIVSSWVGRDAAIRHVQSAYGYSERFHSIFPDLESFQWTVSQRFWGCPLNKNCFEVQGRFNVMSGLDVKEVVCKWNVEMPARKTVLLNTQAREFFVERPLAVNPRTGQRLFFDADQRNCWFDEVTGKCAR